MSRWRLVVCFVSLCTFNFASGLVLGSFAQDRPPRTIQLRGTLFASDAEASEAKFFIDPEGDSETLTLIALDGGFVHQWLRGSRGAHATITISVQR